MRFMKKIVSILAVCGFIAFSVPVSTVPADAAIFYTVSDGVLTIRSQGVIENSQRTKLPWYDESDQITSIVLQDGVTEIGDSLFSDLTALETVDFPNTLTSIGTNSFRNCSSLKSIELPSSLVSIGIGAFGDCTKLQSVQLSEGLESIGSWAFSYCPELSEIQLPETLTEIGSASFYECSSLTSITIPQNVTALNEFTFVLCSALEDITIEGELTYLGGGVFGGTKWFSDQPDWVIVQDKFLQTYKGTDTELVIPDGVEYICDRAFMNKSIQSVVLSDSVKSRCTSLNNLKLSNSIPPIPKNTFSNCTVLTEVTIPDSVTMIEKYAFYQCDLLEKNGFRKMLLTWKTMHWDT